MTSVFSFQRLEGVWPCLPGVTCVEGGPLPLGSPLGCVPGGGSSFGGDGGAAGRSGCQRPLKPPHPAGCRFLVLWLRTATSMGK